MPHADKRFVRLSKVAAEDILRHMTDPRVAQHLPLLSEPWSLETAQAFVEVKEHRWKSEGLGHWAILIEGKYAGWGGFQREGDEWDFGLVLVPEFFGAGLKITSKALDFARRDPRIPFVTFLVPPSRKKLGALRRIGALQLADVNYNGEQFLKFRLDTPLI